MLKSKVLLPSDGSDTAMKAAAYAARLMKINPEMKLTVLVVAPENIDFVELKKEKKGIIEKIDGIIDAKGKEILEKTMRFFAVEGLEVDGLIEKGNPAGIIIEFAGKGKYDHIIMGSRGVSELRDMTIGSVSHKVIHLADCRVTLVK